jgi:hypothetical protein
MFFWPQAHSNYSLRAQAITLYKCVHALVYTHKCAQTVESVCHILQTLECVQTIGRFFCFFLFEDVSISAALMWQGTFLAQNDFFLDRV